MTSPLNGLSSGQFKSLHKSKPAQDLLYPPQLGDLTIPTHSQEYRFFKIEEISEEKPGTYQRAMQNVIGILQNEVDCKLIYLLQGSRERISLYLGSSLDIQPGSAGFFIAFLPAKVLDTVMVPCGRPFGKRVGQ